MPFSAQVVRVLIASPGDTASARGVVRGVLEDWNGLNAEETGVMLLPVMWERDTTPEMSGRAQAAINRQIVDVADVVVGLFWTRLGTPTGEAKSGTVEEIEQFIGSGRPTLLYFSDQPVVPSSVDPEQHARVIAFRRSIEEQDRGLYDTYESDADLARKITAALTRVMRDRFRATASAESVSQQTAAVPEARLVARVEREREINGFSKQGKPQYRNRTRLVIENTGTAAAEDLTIAASAAGEDADATQSMMPFLIGADSAIGRLVPGSEIDFPLILTFGTPPLWDLEMAWIEDGETRMERQTLRI